MAWFTEVCWKGGDVYCGAPPGTDAGGGRYCMGMFVASFEDVRRLIGGE
jgi:hypothetical protein